MRKKVIAILCGVSLAAGALWYSAQEDVSYAAQYETDSREEDMRNDDLSEISGLESSENQTDEIGEDGQEQSETPEEPDTENIGENGGEPQENAGDPQENVEDPQENAGDPQKNDGESQENAGEPQENDGELQENDGETPENEEEGLPEDYLEWIQQARDALKEILAEHSVMALVYLSDEYEVRADASGDSDIVINVPSGQTVYIRDVTVDCTYQVWEYVTFHYEDTEYSGYVLRSNLACSDELFLDWEMEYGMNPAAAVPMATASVSAGYADVNQFPESYRTALTALKKAHPNWTFVKQNTNLEWSDVVYNELTENRNLVSGSFASYKRNELYGQSWYYITEATLEYYLDPRSWLDESHIFMFEQLTYNSSYHTEAAVQKFLNSTFMKGQIPGGIPGYSSSQSTYAKAFVLSGKNAGVSPFHLASRVYQEQGTGSSSLISGTYPGYTGYYNYFNIGASGSTNTAVITSGLEYAKKMGWNSPYASISGGAKTIAANYIARGQDTLYLQKFDVDSSNDGLYWHQYMQNISAPHVEGRKIYEMYSSVGAVNNTFVFKIPVYNNMPSSACKEPTANYSIKVAAPSGYSEQTVYVDGVAYKGVAQNGKLLVTAPNANAKTAVMYKYDSSGIPVGMYVWMLSYSSSSKSYTVTAMSELQDLLTYHGFSIRITGDTGIRFKTGISASLRSKLTGTGVSGYTLKEYGTLAMTQANANVYPMVKGGQKVSGGISYGTLNGKKVDYIYETVDGRYRFTSVLTKLPPEQYKTEIAFRGYAILTKNGQEYIIYGPKVSRSMYALATQMVNSGYYAKGSSADTFLRKIISDAK